MNRYFWLCCQCGTRGAVQHTHNGRPICAACLRDVIRRAIDG